MRLFAAGGARPVRFHLARAAAALLLLSALTVVAFAAAVSWGGQPLSWEGIWQAGSADATIFWSVRVPRVCLAGLVGAALAASGSTLQALMRNPLADPFVLGVSGGAALGATAAMALGVGTVGSMAAVQTASGWEAASGLSATALFAFAGAAGATLLVLSLGQSAARSSPYAILLSGVVFNAIALAAITFIRALVEPERLGEILFWLSGKLGFEAPGVLAALAGVQALAIGGMWLGSGRLNLLMLGEDDAASLGVHVERVRLVMLLLASLSVGAAVSFSGLVGFVGLVVPHLLRLRLGPDQRLLLPASAVGGALFLILADLLARLLFRALQDEPPVGALTALLGGPLFLGMLRRNAAAGST